MELCIQKGIKHRLAPWLISLAKMNELKQPAESICYLTEKSTIPLIAFLLYHQFITPSTKLFYQLLHMLSLDPLMSHINSSV